MAKFNRKKLFSKDVLLPETQRCSPGMAPVPPRHCLLPGEGNPHGGAQASPPTLGFIFLIFFNLSFETDTRGGDGGGGGGDKLVPFIREE